MSSPTRFGSSSGYIEIQRTSGTCYSSYSNDPVAVRLNFSALSGYDESTLALTDISGNLLPRWVENYNKTTPDGTLWYNDVSGDITNGGTNVYLQYGSEIAVSNDSGAFHSDFDLVLLGNSYSDASQNNHTVIPDNVSSGNSPILGGQYYEFNGVSGKLQVPYHPSFNYPESPFTFLIWGDFKYKTRQGFLGRGSYGVDAEYSFGIHPTDDVVLYIINEDNDGYRGRNFNNGFTGNEGLSLWSTSYSAAGGGTWPDIIQLYRNDSRIDNSTVSAGPFTSNYTGTADLIIGDETIITSVPVSGYMKTVMMVSRYYTQEDIQRFYVNTSGWATNYSLNISSGEFSTTSSMGVLLYYNNKDKFQWNK